MTSKVVRPSQEATDGDHERRLRSLERATCGPWVYVGTYPTDPGTTPESPPFENGWVNAGGAEQELRFRWTLDGGPEIQGSITGGALNTTVFTLPDSPAYRNGKSLHGVGVADSGAAIPFKVLTTGEVVCLPPSAGSGGGGGASAGIAYVTVNTGEWLEILTTGSNPNTVETFASSYSDMGIALVADDDIVIGTTDNGNIFIDAESVFLMNAGTYNYNGPTGVNAFWNLDGGYFFNDGYFLYGGDGFEVDVPLSGFGIYLSAPEIVLDADAIDINDGGPALGSGVVLESIHNGVKIEVNGVLAFEVRNDGSVHIRTGTAIIADL